MGSREKANTFSIEEISDLRRAFGVFDKDGDGSITATEVETVMKQLGVNFSKQEMDKMIKEIDRDGNGSIEMEEFVEMMAQRKANLSEEDELREAFHIFDTDGDGFISASEMKHVMLTLGQSLSREDVDEMVKEADKDKDGKISLPEFMNMVLPAK